jgi:hypothetical protein
MISSEHCRRAIFQIYNVQNLEITIMTTFHIYNVVYQAGSRRDPMWVFNFLRFFEEVLYKSNYIIFILSWCRTRTKIRSTSVVRVTTGSQKITVWGPGGTPLGILRVKNECSHASSSPYAVMARAETTVPFSSRVTIYVLAVSLDITLFELDL